MLSKLTKEFDQLIDLNDVFVADIIFTFSRLFADDYLIIYKAFHIIKKNNWKEFELLEGFVSSEYRNYFLWIKHSTYIDNTKCLFVLASFYKKKK